MRPQVFPPLLLALVLLAAAGCGRKAPPGAEPVGSAAPLTRDVQAESADAADEADDGGPAPATAAVGGTTERGSVDDNVPFAPDGTKLASIAWRTWVYTDVGPKRGRLGYLRVGAIVDARGPAIVNSGCEGGWYRINPFGFVCVGKGATLELTHPVVLASARRPERGKALPFAYARAGGTPPHRYFRLAQRDEMRTTEGDYESGARALRDAMRSGRHKDLLGELAGPPPWLTVGKKLEKPYGAKQFLHYSAHAGKTAIDAGFALLTAFEWEERVWGLTTELDLIPLDRAKVVEPSRFHGAVLGAGEDLPVAFVEGAPVTRFELKGSLPSNAGSYERRSPIKLTGEVKNSYLATRDGGWVAPVGLRRIERRKEWPSYATGTRKWIEISIGEQTLVAYEGQKAAFATLVSTGRAGLGDPEKTFSTPRGTFMVHTKHVSATMDGEDDNASDSYNLLDVPFVQYFHKGFALHGTYWHDDFGKVRSHGCVNLSPEDAAWLFEWTDPPVPEHWHGRLNMERGTVVLIHP